MASSANSGVTDNVRHRDWGIPRKCRCGSKSVIRTSETLKNPGRLFYCCPYGSKEDNNHLFKWTDISLVEEMEDVKLVVEEIKGNVTSGDRRLSDIEAQMDTLACETRTCEVVANSFASRIESNKQSCEKEIKELKSKLIWCEKEVKGLRSFKKVVLGGLVTFAACWIIFS